MTSESSRKSFQAKHGVRYTELIRLPYVDLVRMTVVDPMHNLFLGTTKHLFKEIWATEHNLHDKKKLEHIDGVLSCASVPAEIGRIPSRIGSNFNSFTADQWKNWCLYFSLPCLKSHLPEEAYKTWNDFVEACRLLCKPVFSVHDLRIANELLVKFCKRVEQLYGTQAITPNMHMHTHIIECVVEFGPLYSFWLFAFERYNGILGAYYTNNRNIEEQMFARFERTQKMCAMEKQSQFMSSFRTCFDLECNDVGSLASTVSKPVNEDEKKSWEAILSLKEPSAALLSTDGLFLVGTGKTDMLTDPLLTAAKQCLLYIGLHVTDDSFPGSYKRYDELTYMGESYGSVTSKKHSNCNILASWCDLDGNINMQRKITPGRILFFIRFFVNESVEEKRDIILACVEWLQPHSSRNYFDSKSLSIWTHPELCTEPYGPASFLPLKRIVGRFIQSSIKIQNENVAVVTPIVDKVVW